MNRGTIRNLASLAGILMSVAIARPILAQEEQSLEQENYFSAILLAGNYIGQRRFDLGRDRRA